MPIYATPIAASPPSSGATGVGQTVVAPVASSLYGCAVGARTRSVAARQGIPSRVDWTMLSAAGNPVDLTSLGSFPGDVNDPDKSHVTLDIRETVIIPASSSDVASTIRGSVGNASGGAVSFQLTTESVARAGIYMAEATVFDSTGKPAFANQFYVVVNRSITGNSGWISNAPPTIAELRLHIRDSGAKDNPLLDAVQFDDAEIAAAIEKPVLYWNESLPPIQPYTTTTFPFRYNWLEGAVAQLYRMAAHFYRRNYLPVQAGGVSMNDLGKANEYEQIGNMKWAEYKDWVLKQKVSINARRAIGYAPSPYGVFYRDW